MLDHPAASLPDAAPRAEPPAAHAATAGEGLAAALVDRMQARDALRDRAPQAINVDPAGQEFTTYLVDRTPRHVPNRVCGFGVAKCRTPDARKRVEHHGCIQQP